MVVFLLWAGRRSVDKTFFPSTDFSWVDCIISTFPLALLVCLEEYIVDATWYEFPIEQGGGCGPKRRDLSLVHVQGPFQGRQDVLHTTLYDRPS